MVSTSEKITTGNDAHVKAMWVDAYGNVSPVSTSRQARRVGPFSKFTAGATVTGTTSETTLATITIPAGVLGLDGAFRLTAPLLVAGTNSTKTLRVKLGSTTLETMTFVAGFSAAAKLEVLIFNDGSASAQIVSTNLRRHNASPDVRLTTSSEDTSSAVNLVITGQLANGSDALSVQAYLAELVGTDRDAGRALRVGRPPPGGRAGARASCG